MIAFAALVFSFFLYLLNCLYLNPQVFLAFALMIFSPIPLAGCEQATVWGLSWQQESTHHALTFLTIVRIWYHSYVQVTVSNKFVIA